MKFVITRWSFVLSFSAPFVMIIYELNAENLSNKTGQRTTLYVGSMAPMTGKRAWWGAGIPLAIEMAFEDINKRDDILRDYELKLISRDTQGDTGRGNKVFYNFLNEGKVRLILGPSRSNVAESAGATAKYYNMIQVSPSAASGELSKKDVFPYLFRTVPALSAANRTFIAIAKTFAWTRVAILYQSRELFTSAATSLREECKKNGIEVISYGSFLMDPKNQIKHLKIYKHNMHGQKYAWVVHTPDKDGWWRRTFANVNCTPEEVNEGAKGTLLVNYMWLSSSKNQTVSGMTPEEFKSSFIQKARKSDITDTSYKGFAYDAAWLVALALNRTAQNLAPTIPLDTVAFGDRNFSDLMKKNLLSTEFQGVTSFLKLNDKGDRSGVFEISQLRGAEFEAICSHDVGRTSLNFYPDKDFRWEGGRAPMDRQSEHRQLYTISMSVFFFMCSMASFGIFLAFTFLCFNIKNRNKRFVKMSSPNLNNMIILGCILSYISVILFAFDGEHLKTELCTTRTTTICIGFTFVFGSLFSKTWRVHKVTRITSAKKLIIRDLHLFGVIGVLILIDAVILLLWNFLDPFQKKIRYLPALNNHEDDNILQLPYTYTCEVNRIEIWLGLLYSYKGILLLFGLFLAWETRNVKIPALNDSQHIGMAVYNVVIVCIVGTPVVTFVHEKQFETSFIITGICILFSTTSTLCIVFVPKIAALRKNGLNEEYRARTRTFSSLDTFTVTTAKCSCSGKDTINKDGELQRLREMLDMLQREKKRISHSNGTSMTTQL